MTDPLPDKDRADPLPAETVTRETVPLPHNLPDRIGRYHIKRVIASGGMGTVYEATQDNPRRVVAVKVMKQGITSKSALRRFEYEGQILGRLRHPGIAQIYEAGTHDDGHGAVPYFAMEYIPNAKTITKYADEKKLGTRQRMELFAKVCDAIHHGHQKGIIHRDLKPSNILVTSDSTTSPLAKGGTGGVGQVKIIDFGVARCTDSDLAVTTLQTDVGQLIGTLQYMSPEQCEGDPHDIDTRSDVYALGVVFYQLLCGKLPYDVTRMAMHQATRAIREQSPTKLSTLNHTLRGDVETIAIKALEKERERRYQSAADLGHDIQRYLDGEAILARRASIVYQLRLFARRNKAVFASLAAVFIVLVAGIIVSTSLYLRAEGEAMRAKKERDKAERIASFMGDILKGAGPSVALGRDATMLREMLDSAAKRIHDGELNGAPEAELQLRGTIGATYQELGVYDRAGDMLQPAAALAHRLYGQEHLDVVSSLNNLGLLLGSQGKLSEAEPLFREALAIRRKLLGEEHPDVAASVRKLVQLLQYQGKHSEAELLSRESLAMTRKVLGEEHPEVASRLSDLAWLLRSQDEQAGHPGMHELALLLKYQGKHSEAETLFRESLAMRRKLLGEAHPDVAASMRDLAALLRDEGNLSEAEPLFREALAICRKFYGEEHPDVAHSLSDLAFMLEDQDKLSEAESLFRESLAMLRKLRGEIHPEVVGSLRSLGWMLQDQGKLSEAEPLFREELAVSRKLYGEGHEHVTGSLNNLASLLQNQGKLSEAEPLFREALAIQRKVRGEETPLVAGSVRNLVSVLKDQGKLSEAELLWRESLTMLRKRLGEEHPEVASRLNQLASLLQDQGKLSEAELALREALTSQQATLPEGNPALSGTQTTLGLVLSESAWQKRDAGDEVAAAAKADEAERLLRDTWRARRNSLPADDWRLPNTESILGDAVAATAVTNPSLDLEARLSEAESLLLEGYQGLVDNPNVPAIYRAERIRQALQRIARVYEAWDAAEPGKGYAEKAAEWRTKLDETPKSQNVETPK